MDHFGRGSFLLILTIDCGNQVLSGPKTAQNTANTIHLGGQNGSKCAQNSPNITKSAESLVEEDFWALLGFLGPTFDDLGGMWYQNPAEEWGAIVWGILLWSLWA